MAALPQLEYHLNDTYLDDLYTYKLKYRDKRPPDQIEEKLADPADIIYKVCCEDGIFYVIRKKLPLED